MGLLSGLMGNATEVDASSLQRELSDMLIAGENIDLAFKVIRDLFVFTDRRLILVDKQGLTGRKCDYHSIPYRSITHFAVETAGTFDTDSELKIWVSGTHEPIKKEFKKGSNLVAVNKALATAILR